jgi:hypothetical protein
MALPKRAQRNLRVLHHVVTDLKKIIRVNPEVRIAAAAKLNGGIEPANLHCVLRPT